MPKKIIINFYYLFFIKLKIFSILVGIPGIEPGSLAALVFELLDYTYV